MGQVTCTSAAGLPFWRSWPNRTRPEFPGRKPPVCVLLFGFTTVLNYYYQGETAIAYLLQNKHPKVRKTAILVLRFVVPVVFFLFAIATSSATWAVGSAGVGIMVWTNVVVLMVMSPTILKVYRDYREQRKAGIEEPIFDPEKLGIKNADLWMEINKDKLNENATPRSKE